jgi:hypothetical protein
MARRRYRRSYRRRSGRWAPNIVKISSTVNAPSGEFSNSEDLALNPIQLNTGVSQAFTVKNFEISFTIEAETVTALNLIESITAYIMYVPQGMTVTNGYYAEHPEYIMAYKYLGQPTAARLNSFNEQQIENQQYQPYRIRTRLSRKLQTGDRVILYIQGSNQSTTTQQYNINGIVRWWSKAN